MSQWSKKSKRPVKSRDERIMQYHTHIGEYDADACYTIFAEDATIKPIGNTAAGGEDAVRWHNWDMVLQGLYHDMERRHHAMEVSFAEGEFGCTLPDWKEMNGSFVTALAFGAKANEISDLKTYTTLRPTM